MMTPTRAFASRGSELVMCFFKLLIVRCTLTLSLLYVLQISELLFLWVSSWFLRSSPSCSSPAPSLFLFSPSFLLPSSFSSPPVHLVYVILGFSHPPPLLLILIFTRLLVPLFFYPPKWVQAISEKIVQGFTIHNYPECANITNIAPCATSISMFSYHLHD